MNTLLAAITIVASISSVGAFTSTNQIRSRSNFLMSSNEIPISAPFTTEMPATTEIPVTPVKKERLKAKWLPVGGVLAPAVLDGTLAGDVGFDPIGFSRTKGTLYWMREAELKHGRLAMLAAVGWPLSELWHKELAQALGLESILAGKSGELAPSLLNGGLSSVYASGMLVMSMIIASLLEGQAMNKGDIYISNEKPAGYIPGDFGFDPLNFYKLKGDKKLMETTEIKNGRLAMIAITFYAFSEFVTKVPVVQQTPFLF